MKRYLILSSSPFGEQNIPFPFSKHQVLLETEEGYSEVQGYACTESQKEDVLEEALNAFCDSRASLNTDLLAFLR